MCPSIFLIADQRATYGQLTVVPDESSCRGSSASTSRTGARRHHAADTVPSSVSRCSSARSGS